MIGWTERSCDKLIIFQRDTLRIAVFIEEKSYWRNPVKDQLAGCRAIYQRHMNDMTGKLVFCFVGKSPHIKGPLKYPKIDGREVIHLNPNDNLFSKLQRMKIVPPQ